MVYDPEDFFTKRFKEFGMSLHSAGHRNKANEKEYLDGANVIKENFGEHFLSAKQLDIGVGTGFYIQYFREMGTLIYCGIDITDVLFNTIKKENPDVFLYKHDITDEPMEGPQTFNVITMIDVTQHIVNDDKFKQAMERVKGMLADDGIFIVTSHLKPDQMWTEYERFRPMEHYTELFEGYCFTIPAPFRDKWIFSIRKEQDD